MAQKSQPVKRGAKQIAAMIPEQGESSATGGEEDLEGWAYTLSDKETMFLFQIKLLCLPAVKDHLNFYLDFWGFRPRD